LSEFLGTEPPPEPDPVEFLPWDDSAAEGLGIFDYINMALAWHPPAIHEVEAMASFSQIGVIPGRRYSTAGFSAREPPSHSGRSIQMHPIMRFMALQTVIWAAL
jgi:hypothetical protein